MIRVFLGTFLASVFVIVLGLIALAAGGADSLDAYLILASILFAIGFLVAALVLPRRIQPHQQPTGQPATEMA